MNDLPPHGPRGLGLRPAEAEGSPVLIPTDEASLIRAALLAYSDRSVPSETTIRVRYKDTDVMGIVYYGNYLTYFEVGRVEYLRERGYPMSEVQRKIHLPVVEASARYHRPARLDDLLRVQTWVGERRRASFTFYYGVYHAETRDLIATGQTRHCCVEPESQKLVPVPEWLRAILPVEEGEKRDA